MKLDYDTLLGIAVILATVGMMIYIILDHRQKGDLIEALTEGLKEANSNARALDLAESLATKVVPVDFPDRVNKAADFIESLTPDQMDRLVDQVRKYLVAITDRQPNIVTEVVKSEALHEGKG